MDQIGKVILRVKLGIIVFGYFILGMIQGTFNPLEFSWWGITLFFVWFFWWMTADVKRNKIKTPEEDTLKIELEKLHSGLAKRIEQLQTNRGEYLTDDNTAASMKCIIKIGELTMVANKIGVLIGKETISKY